MEGYKRLATYILVTIICDLNVEFIKRWISYKSRTRDQTCPPITLHEPCTNSTEKASGKFRWVEQTIMHPIECLLAPEVYVLASQERIYGARSLESYIKLAGVAVGSIKELAADYEDFLRQRQLAIWPKDDGRIRVFRAFRAVWNSPNIPNTPKLPNDPEEAANMLLTFCQMETYLLSKQIAALKEKFIKEGGFRENLFRKRLEFKKVNS